MFFNDVSVCYYEKNIYELILSSKILELPISMGFFFCYANLCKIYLIADTTPFICDVNNLSQTDTFQRKL